MLIIRREWNTGNQICVCKAHKCLFYDGYFSLGILLCAGVADETWEPNGRAHGDTSYRINKREKGARLKGVSAGADGGRGRDALAATKRMMEGWNQGEGGRREMGGGSSTWGPMAAAH